MLSAHGKSVPGARHRNEDRILVDLSRGVYAVADGVGGLPMGDRASGAVVHTLASFPLHRVGNTGTLHDAFLEAHRRVRQLGKMLEPAGLCGSTLTAVFQRGNDTWELFHIGDSAAFRLSGGNLHSLTQPHHKNAPAVQFPGHAAPRAVPKVLSSFVGMPSEPVFQWCSFRTLPGDRLLLLTDGVADFVDPATIAALAQAQPKAAGWTESLVCVARLRGSMDNLSAVAIDL